MTILRTHSPVNPNLQQRLGIIILEFEAIGSRNRGKIIGREASKLYIESWKYFDDIKNKSLRDLQDTVDKYECKLYGIWGRE